MASASPSERRPSQGAVPLGPRPEARRVAVLIDPIAEEASGADPKAPAVSTLRIIEALDSLGFDPVELPLYPDRSAEWLRTLIHGDFDIAFNLCETLGGQAAGEHLAAAAIELLQLPMTGASSATLLLCLNKDRCSAILRAHGFRVPDWQLLSDGDQLPDGWETYPAIVKPAAEDASNGIHMSSVAHSLDELERQASAMRKNWRQLMIQEYIDGREINLAIVGEHLLPPAEIDFSELPDGCPAIVTFSAKWHETSAEYTGTRALCPAPLPPHTAEELQLLAARAWSLLDGRGYARVDVRLGSNGTPYIIDINPNPDLSTDAGLARQARVAGWSYEELIGRILEDALSSHDGPQRPEWVVAQSQQEAIAG